MQSACAGADSSRRPFGDSFSAGSSVGGSGIASRSASPNAIRGVEASECAISLRRPRPVEGPLRRVPPGRSSSPVAEVYSDYRTRRCQGRSGSGDGSVVVTSTWTCVRLRIERASIVRPRFRAWGFKGCSPDRARGLRAGFSRLPRLAPLLGVLTLQGLTAGSCCRFRCQLPSRLWSCRTGRFRGLRVSIDPRRHRSSSVLTRLQAGRPKPSYLPGFLCSLLGFLPSWACTRLQLRPRRAHGFTSGCGARCRLAIHPSVPGPCNFPLETSAICMAPARWPRGFSTCCWGFRPLALRFAAVDLASGTGLASGG
jgi:hypothetical protein